MNFRPQITYEAGCMAVRFEYNKQLVQLVAGIDRRAKWEEVGKYWKFPAEQMTVKAVCDMLGFPRERLPAELYGLLEAPPARPPANLLLVGAYDWPTKPLDHQRGGLAELLEHPRWGLAWEQGCGKTHPTVNRIRYGIAARQFRGPVLIFAPRNVAVSVWPKELLQHGGIPTAYLGGTAKAKMAKRREWLQRAGVTATLLVGSKAKRLELLNFGLEISKLASDRAGHYIPPIFITNYEATQVIWEQLRRVQPDVVICDECQYIKKSTIKTSERVRLISDLARYRYALSGTPAPNGPLDIFGTLLFLDPNVAGTQSKTLFEARYAIKRPLKEGSNTQVILGYKEMDDLQARVARIMSRLKKTDCLDLPPKTYQRRSVELSDEQARVYKELRNKAVAELRTAAREGTLTVANILTESLRLLQVCGGFVPDDLGAIYPLEPNYKLDALDELLDETDGKVIVWANFVAEIDAIVKRLKARAGRKTVCYSGATNDTDRKAAIEAFQFGSADYFVGTPAAGGTGLTLTASSTAVYFSRGWNLTHWLQSQDRNHRIGTLWPVTIYILQAAGTVDEKVDAALLAKENMQETLLGRGAEEMIEAMI